MAMPPDNLPTVEKKILPQGAVEAGGRHFAQLWGQGRLPGAEWKAQWELGSK